MSKDWAGVALYRHLGTSENPVVDVWRSFGAVTVFLADGTKIELGAPV